ncbi:MAG: RsmB/NOP family class I SAM-dependent RNA methyltransferase [Candidatus Altiarchaeota archaeon]|nr:RsmB/NOP family class I SAM-dependent RNA methyltransferase [Candidatus Altiarchaeota archaeon]
MAFPKEFEDYHRKLFGVDYVVFQDHITEYPTRWSLRVNTLKSTMRDVRRTLSEYGIEYGPIPWCAEGLWVSQQNLDTVEHQLGHYFIQSASSMIAPQLLGCGEYILDLCAAPGGKTTHLAQLMNNRGTLIANEHVPARMKSLVYNIQRCGVSNTTVLKGDGARIGNLKLKFDKILVDAPCSGVGTLRQSREILSRWNLGWVRGLSGLQKKLALTAFDSLKKGGTMVYTTCTTTLEENEEVVTFLLSQREDAKLVSARLEGIKLKSGLTEETRDCTRIDFRDGLDSHFFAKVVKNG